MNLSYLYGKPKKKPRPNTIRKRMMHAYYMRNRDRLKAAALARYYARKMA